MYITKCSNCGTALCSGCKQAYKPFFTGYKPQFYFRTTKEPHWIDKAFKELTLNREQK